MLNNHLLSQSQTPLRISFVPCTTLDSCYIAELKQCINHLTATDDAFIIGDQDLESTDSFLELLNTSTDDEFPSKECIVVSAASVSHLIDSDPENNKFEQLFREFRANEVSVLLLVDRSEAATAEKLLEIGNTLELNIEAAMVGTPAMMIAHRIKQMGEQARKKQAILEQQELVEETNNHLIREQEVAKSVFEKVTSEHQLALPNVRQWLSPIAVFNGDVFMSAPTPSNDLLVLLGDFTGHGLGASLGAIPLAATFYRMASKGFALRDIVIEMNRRLNESLPTGFFCCAIAAQINFEHGTVEYINAGLPDCYWLKQASGEIKPLVSTAIPLGILNPAQFDVETQRTTASLGDRLFMLSDGVLETENQHGEAFGTHRLVKSISNEYLKAYNSCSSPDYMKAMQAAVKEFISGQEHFDDISFAEVEIVSAEDFTGSFTQVLLDEKQEPSSWSMQMNYKAPSLINKDPIPQVLNLLLDEPGLKNHTGSIFTIVSELYNNALDHGVLKLDSSVKDGPSGFSAFYEQRHNSLQQLVDAHICFEISYEACEETGCLTIIITDSGAGFDWHRKHKDSLEQNSKSGEPLVHGRGLILLRDLCDSLTFNDKGNSVKAVFSWDRSESKQSGDDIDRNAA